MTDPATQKRKSAPVAHSLSRRASLGAVANAVQLFVRFVTGFVVSPLIIRGLGGEVYGAWTMIQQTVGYLALADGRASGTLKFTLAIRQHDSDMETRRRQIGAAAITSLLTLPIAFVLGFVLVAAAPWLIRADPRYQTDVRWAVALSCVAVALTPVLFLPGNVLRGMNLEYKGAVASTTALVCGGILSAAAVLLGLGITGVAGAGLATAVVGGLVYYNVARRALPWFGYARPTRREFGVFTRQTAWLFLGSFGQLLLNSSDLLVVGALLGPSAAAVYAITSAVLRMAGDPLFSFLSAATTGMAGLCGRREWRRVEQLRLEMHLIAIALMTLLGVGVIVLNESFLHLWVGSGYYAGRTTNAILVVAAAQGIWLRLDGMLADALLQFRLRAELSIFSGLLGLVAGAGLAWLFGLPGMAAGTVLGRTVAVIGLPLLVGRASGISMTSYLACISRPIATSAVLFVLAGLLPSRQLDLTVFFASGALLGAVTMAVTWSVGLSREHRSTLRRRLRSQFESVFNVGSLSR